MKYRKIKKIAKGWSSYVWKIQSIDEKNKGKIFILKEVREKSNRKNLAEREGKMLSFSNTVFVGPKIEEINHKKNFVIMEYIKGPKFLDFVMSEEFEHTPKKDIYNFVKELIRQCLELDNIGLRHTQLQVGKNILVTKKRIKGKNILSPVIIDFEKASIDYEKKKEKNFGQITSFLFYNPHGAVAKKIRDKLEVQLK